MTANPLQHLLVLPFLASKGLLGLAQRLLGLSPRLLDLAEGLLSLPELSAAATDLLLRPLRCPLVFTNGASAGNTGTQLLQRVLPLCLSASGKKQSTMWEAQLQMPNS